MWIRLGSINSFGENELSFVVSSKSGSIGYAMNGKNERVEEAGKETIFFANS